MDFVINYKYNQYSELDMEEFVKDTVDKYFNFISSLNITNNIFVCELPVPHIDDDNMKKILASEENFRNAKYKLGEDMTIDLNKINVIPKERLYHLTILFNKHMNEQCIENRYKFVEINKYYNTKYIPDNYIRSNKLDHHLKDNFYKFFMSSLDKLITN